MVDPWPQGLLSQHLPLSGPKLLQITSKVRVLHQQQVRVCSSQEPQLELVPAQQHGSMVAKNSGVLTMEGHLEVLLYCGSPRQGC